MPPPQMKPGEAIETHPGRARIIVPLIAGPVLASAALLLIPALAPGIERSAAAAAAVLIWMAVWWVSEAAPLAITSLLPLILFPFLGVMPAREAAAPFADRIIFLFLGGFLLALGMEKWGLHRRIALSALSLVGTRTIPIIGGVMLTTGILSMWVSNTACALMMLPIGASLITLLERQTGRDAGNFAIAMMLGIAWAANIGGVGTPIGTPPNAILIAFIESRYEITIGFLQWTLVGVPFVLIFLTIAWWYLTRVACRFDQRELPGGDELIRSELRALGPMNRGERAVMIVFFITIAGWMLREPIARFFPAAEEILTRRIDDAAVALFGGILLFIIPVDPRRGQFVMDWSTASRLPWEVLLLFGGGLSLAAGVQSSGLDDVIAASLAAAGQWPIFLMLLLLVTVSVFLSEVTSNTAQANLFLPILAGVAAATGNDPMRLLAACAIALSCAFMMPMGTPPNAIVFASGRLTIRRMASAGFGLNLIGIALVMLAAYTLIPWILPAL